MIWLPKPIADWLLRLLIFAMGPLLALLGAGCEGGLPLMTQANPQTTISVDPASHRIRIFTNDGRALETKNVLVSWKTKDGGEGQFKADLLTVTERSVENRQANVDQMLAGAKQIEATGLAISNVLGTALGPFRGATASISGEGPLGKAAGEIKLGDQTYVPIILPSAKPDTPPTVIMIPKAEAPVTTQPAA